MKRSLSLFAAALISALPLAGLAEEAAAPPPAQTVTFTPYGFILVNGMSNAGAFSNPDFGFQATGGAAGGVGQFLGNARQSRLGVRVGLPDAIGAQLKAVVEIDFQGGFAAGLPAATAAPNATTSVTPATSLGSNTEWYRPNPRLRLAYATATWNTGVGPVTVLAGQDYGLVAPLFATSLAYVAKPLFWGAGNFYTRAAQLRVQGELGKAAFGSDAFGFTYAVAALDPLSANEGTPTLGAGNRSRMPALEARVSGVYKMDKKTVFELGVSGHYSKERYAIAGGTDEDLERWTGAGDLQITVPFSLPGNTQPLIAIKGEAFAGVDDNMYFSGQFFPTAVFLDAAGASAAGVTVGTAATTPAAHVRGVHEQGIWGQLIISPLDYIQIVGGAGIQQPKYADLQFKNGFAAAGAATVLGKNEQFAGGIIFSASKNLKASVEVLDTLSTYVQTSAVAAVPATPANPATANPGKPATAKVAAQPTTVVEHQQYSLNVQYSF